MLMLSRGRPASEAEIKCVRDQGRDGHGDAEGTEVVLPGMDGERVEAVAQVEPKQDQDQVEHGDNERQAVGARPAGRRLRSPARAHRDQNRRMRCS